MALTQLAPPYPVFTDKNGDPLDNGYLYFGEVDKNPETNPIQVYYDSRFTQPVAQPIRTSNGYVMRNGSPALIYANSLFSVTVRDKNSDLVIYSPVGYGVDPASITGSVLYDDFIGDGSTVVFTMSASPSTKNATNVYIDGVYQSKNNYDTNNFTLTFTTAPPLYSAIEVVTQETSIIGGASSQQISYNQGGVGSITRTVQSRLRDSISIKDFGAAGDGTTDDSAAFQAAELAAGSTAYIYLPEGVYSCPETTYVPVKSYFGPGYVKFGGDGTYTDTLTYRAPQGGGPIYNPLFNDNKRGLVTIYGSGAGAAIDPSLGSNKLSTFVGDRAGNITSEALRSTAVGGWAMRFADEPKYFDAFGTSAMQYSRTGNRNFGLGNNAAKWLGTNDPVGDDHDFWKLSGTDVWTNKDFESVYPNVRNDLDGSTASTYSGSPRTAANLTAFGDVAPSLIPADDTACENNGALGRDALIHGLTVTGCLALGYKSLAQMIDGEKTVAVGRSSGELGLWHEQDVFIGSSSGYRAIATTDNVFMGFNAGVSAASAARNVAIGSEVLEDAYDAELDTTHQLTSKTDYKMVGNTAIGQRAGANLKEATGNILLGTKAGQDIGSAETRDATAILAIQNADYNSAVPIISGNLVNGRVGVNVHHDLAAGTLDAAALSSQLTVVEGSITAAPNNANSAARGILVHRTGAATGITISTDNDQNGNLFFADTDDNNVGGMQYDHTSDKLNFRVGDEVEISVRESATGQSIFNINNIPISASGLSSGDVYSDSGTLKIVA